MKALLLSAILLFSVSSFAKESKRKPASTGEPKRVICGRVNYSSGGLVQIQETMTYIFYGFFDNNWLKEKNINQNDKICVEANVSKLVIEKAFSFQKFEDSERVILIDLNDNEKK